MKKEEIELFVNNLPFEIKTKEGKILTVCDIIRPIGSSIAFKDKFGSLHVIELYEISKAHEKNNHKFTNNKLHNITDDNKDKNKENSQKTVEKNNATKHR